MPNTKVWHWAYVREDLLFQSGYIHDYSRTRMKRLIRRKEKRWYESSTRLWNGCICDDYQSNRRAYTRHGK